MRTALLCLFAAVSASAAEPLVLSTSLPIQGRDVAALAFDGDPATAFRSARPGRDGDDFLVALPAGTAPTAVEVDGAGLPFAVLEFSADGANFRPAAAFSNGTARAAAPAGLRALRLRLTGSGGEEAVTLREIRLAGVDKPATRFHTRVEIHTETVPETRRFAEKARALCEEWYPRLYTQFDTPDGPAPRSVLHLWFQDMPGVAHTRFDIHISAEWVTKKAPDDFGMVIHELFHVVQGYPRGAGEGWLTEGLADYVRHALFEPAVPLPKPDPAKSSYRDAYKTTARFLIWTEKKWPGLAVKLNAAARARQPVRDVFTREAGKDVDALWAEYIREGAG